MLESAIGKLYPFNAHPFKVLDDEKMQETVESIREHGVICPLVVRTGKCDQLLQSFQRQELCLYRYEHRIGGCKGVR